MRDRPAASAGKIESYARCVVRDEHAWKRRPSSPTASSTTAYQSSGSRSRSERRPGDERAERHAAEEDHEHDDLRVRAVADEQAEVADPDRLVDEPGGAGEDEDRAEEEQHDSQMGA